MLELEVVKEHCRIEPDFTDDDSLLTLYIGACFSLRRNMDSSQNV